ncbi:autotransporter outer membrane beta-barrel domain-containing protein, partial [Polynucleobacter sp. 86C-FISCH]|uniref:autotransporter outer membrane beta-barrel domain-containing protein n=1 Tax=Polynucleobacter sp. 86C-FISCH TaxID=2689101 RepID=UPI001C0C089C
AFMYRNITSTPSSPGTTPPPLVDILNTYSAVAKQGYQLNSVLNAQNTLLRVGLNYDCTVYGANNVCVGVGGRYTDVNNPTSTQTAGNIQLGYRPTPQTRVGVFLDQGIHNTAPSSFSIKNSQPLFGLFAAYGGDLGPSVKVSGAYGQNNANITRTALTDTEAGQGSTSIIAQGAQLETAYGFALGQNWIAAPLLGVRATEVKRNGYTEDVGATFPVTYNAVKQSATTAYAGAKIMGYVLPNVSVGASAGVEQDLSSNMDNYTGSIYFLGVFNQAAPAVQKTRAFTALNASYWIDKNQRVSLGAYYNQQSLNSANGITGLLSYTIGL